MSRFFLLLAACNGLAVVALGAFGAPGLESLLSGERLDVYRTGVLYHMFHVLALFMVGILCQVHKPTPQLFWSGNLFQAGIILFSGSLYVLTISGLSWLGMVTPVGGVAFLLGWALLISHAVHIERGLR